MAVLIWATWRRTLPRRRPRVGLIFTSGRQWLGSFFRIPPISPVCTTELGTVAKLKREFECRALKVIAISVDPFPPTRADQGHQ